MKITEDEKTLIWVLGFRMAKRNGYKILRDQRLIAMGFENGYIAAIRAEKRGKKL